MRTFKAVAAVLLPMAIPSLALAHPGHGEHGFLQGIQHPLTGLDHVLALIAVGLLAARMTGASRWLMPTLFLAGNAIGALIAMAGFHLPGMELLIGLSVLAGGLLLIPASVSDRFAIGAMAAFGMFHGCAHVQEATGPLGSYVLGIALSSAIVLAASMAIGILTKHDSVTKSREAFHRLAGVSLVLCAVAILFV